MRKILIFLLLLGSLVYAKEFTLKSISGEVYHAQMTPLGLKIKEFPSKVIMLDFFGANCPPCIAELPELVKFQKTFGETVQLIGVQSSSKRSDKEMLKFVQKHHINYPVINLKDAEALISYAQENTDWNGVLPYKLVYDFDTSLSYRLYGMVNWEKLTEILQNL